MLWQTLGKGVPQWLIWKWVCKWQTTSPLPWKCWCKNRSKNCLRNHKKSRHQWHSYARNSALCGYPLVKMELEIQTRFLPRLPFSCNSIISDKIWRKMSLSLSIFLVLPQISLVKYYETIKILMQIFWYFRSHFGNVEGPREKCYFEVFFSAFFPNNCLILDKYVMGIFFLQILSSFSPVSAGIIIFWSKLSKN